MAAKCPKCGKMVNHSITVLCPACGTPLRSDLTTPKENRFYIYEAPINMIDFCYEKIVRKTVRKIETRRFLFFKYEITVPEEVTVNERYSIDVPLFLYGDGENFYEYFTKRFIFRREKCDRFRGFIVPGIYFSHPYLLAVFQPWDDENRTFYPWLNCAVKEYGEYEFQKKLSETIGRLNALGIDRKRTFDRINYLCDVWDGLKAQRK